MSFADKFAPRKVEGNFVNNIIRQKALVYVLTCSFDGRMAWYVFEVQVAKRKEFDERFKASGALKLDDFGTVHHSSWGEEPPEALKIELRQKYGLYE